MDVSQMTDEALVNAFTDSVMEVRCDGTGGDPSPIQRLQYQEQHTEILRRLASAARPEQVTLAMVNRVVQAILAQDIPDEGYVVNPLWTRLSTRMTSALAQLPWPHGSGVDGE